MRALAVEKLKRITEALASDSYITTKNDVGCTHDFYHYPARFAPSVARAIIETFSKPNDWVLDPFMGGGTTIIEGILLGRRMIGVDKNALAHFVTDVRTTPLSENDEWLIEDWADLCAERLAHGADLGWVDRPTIKNLPEPVKMFAAGALALAEFPLRRQRAFARCALLRIGQWALDCRDFTSPSRSYLARRFPTIVREMLAGLREFVEGCREVEFQKSAIRNARLLRHRSAVGLETDSVLGSLPLKPRLVFTSPPYPGVHVLYHRWQYRGRKETPAPYWIASVPDGYGESFYTGGSRTPTGLNNYFEMIRGAFTSVGAMIDRKTIVAQLVGFSDSESQLPRYLQAMELAGYEECSLEAAGRPTRSVPHRKWYAKLKGPVDAASEILLVHRLRRKK